MNRRAREAFRGVAAMAGLLCLVAAPPAVLVRFVGWPLPRSIPDLEAISTATRSGIDDMVVVKVLAVLAWALWAQIAAAAAVETGALLRGHAPRRAPVLPGLQTVVGRLVATAALVVVGLSSPRATPLPMARLADVAVQPGVPDEVAPPPTIPSRNDGTPSEGAEEYESRGVYVVRRNDSWWAVAERTLGDGQRWKELRSLNLGRTMPDGTVIDESSDVILPGWELTVPAEASSQPRSVDNSRLASEVVVERGDNLWSIAERRLAQTESTPASEERVRYYWEKLMELNRDQLVDRDNPGRIYAGQVVRMPATVNGASPSERPPATEVPPPALVPSEPRPAPPPPTSPTTSATRTAAASPPPSSPDTRPVRVPPSPAPIQETNRAGEGRDIAPVGFLGAASTVLAVGITAAVGRRRRRRQMQLPARTQAPVPPPELDELRAELSASADVDHAARLHRALRDVAGTLAGRGSDVRPRLIQVSGPRVEALLTQAMLPAPPSWRPEASGAAWVLNGEPRDRGDDAAAPCPTLVSIGAPEAGTELYLDLEAEGIVTLTGDNHETADVARSWVLELATSPLASGVSVTVVGDTLVPSSSPLERVRVATSWDEVADDALAWVEQSAGLMGANRWPTPAAGRMSDRRGDDLAPLVLVVAGRPDDVRFERLCTAVLEQQVTVTVVVVGDEVDGATRVEVGGGELRIPSLGLVCSAQAVTVEAADEVGQLLEDASHLPAQLSLMPLPRVDPPVMVGFARDGYHEPPYEILVRFLGEIGVVGGNRKLKPKQTAVLAYIALHAPVASERVEDAVWVVLAAHRKSRSAINESRGDLSTWCSS